MRVTKSANGIKVKAYSGTTGILLAFNLDLAAGAAPAADFLGFALKRQRPNGEWEWLSGMKPFPNQPHEDGELIPSNVSPIQAFRWSDYTALPDTKYVFEIHGFYNTGATPWIGPRLVKGPTVEIVTQGIKQKKHVILFPRAVAASQAFSRKFRSVSAAIDAAPKGKKKDVPLPPEAYVWLSRGVKEYMVNFIERAEDATWAIDIAIYEYDQVDLRTAVEMAQKAGAQLRVLYHYKSASEKRSQENEKHMKPIRAANKKRRKPGAIFHHKFVVLSRIENGVKSPKAVMMGSTNFTDNAVYRQANVVHAVEDAGIAQNYLALFDEIWRDPDHPAVTKDWIDTFDPIATGPGIFTGFSPRSDEKDLEEFARLIGTAGRDVLFATAFDLNARIKEALLGQANDPILRYGVEDTASNELSGFHADRTANFVATAQLDSGLEGWLKESSRAGFDQTAKRIHAKIVVVDFTGDSPTIISGSHNLSANASAKNDENYFVIIGNTDVADAYGVEVLRFYDHYRARYWLNKLEEDRKAGKEIAPLLLKTDNAWALPFYKANSLKQLDRTRFCP